MAGTGPQIPSFSNLQKHAGNSSDDPFSAYNASKTSDDPFASYNAKKSSERSSSERPNLTISVPFRKKSEEFPTKVRRVSQSQEREDYRVEVKYDGSRDRDRYYDDDRSRGRRDERDHSRSHRDYNHDKSRRYDRNDDRRYDERRHRDKHYDRKPQSEDDKRRGRPRDERRDRQRSTETKPHVDLNEIRQIPAFRMQEVAPPSHTTAPGWDRREEPVNPPPAPLFLPPEQSLPPRPPQQMTPYPQTAPPQYYPEKTRSRPPYLQPAASDPKPPTPTRGRPRDIPHFEHQLQKPEHQPEPYPHWESRPPPPPHRQDPSYSQHNRYRNESDRHARDGNYYPREGDRYPSSRDRHGPPPDHYYNRRPPPPPQKIPNISDVADIMKGLKENANKNLESTKELITTLLPPKASTSEAIPVDEGALPPRLGDSSYSSAAVPYDGPAPLPKPKTPVRKGPDYTNMFTKTANIYKSNWVKTPEKEGEGASGSKEDAAEKERIIRLSGSLEVDLDDVNASQVNLLAKYLKFRTRGLRVVADNLPLRVKKDSDHDDDSSALETVKSVRRAFNTKPEPVPGTLSCDTCRKYNLPPDKYRRHVNSDFHCWMVGSWQHKLPGYLPRFSMVWCTICMDFFMITFEGNTVLGHEDKEDHRKNKSVYRLQYDDVPAVKFCLLSELRTTKVKMPTPLKCKYFTPREAIESYKSVYSKLCDRNLVTD